MCEDIYRSIFTTAGGSVAGLQVLLLLKNENLGSGSPYIQAVINTRKKKDIPVTVALWPGWCGPVAGISVVQHQWLCGRAFGPRCLTTIALQEI